VTATEPSTEALPLIISVDDHVVEPANIWQDRLPDAFKDRGPRIERDTGKFLFEGGTFSYEKGGDDGVPCDWWLYEELVYPMPRLSACAGRPRDEIVNVPITYDEMQPAFYDPVERLKAMDANHMEASLCFPNTLPRFCGQTFMERGDKELSLLCVQAYNDWMIDEWCGAPGARGRLIPMTIVPLWDAELAAAEVRRCAEKGSFAVAFSENPYPLGLPSFHDPDKYWDPFFQACEDTRSVVCMHIGSSSKMPATSPDAPFAVSSTLTFQNAMGSMCDYLLSGILVRFPNLKIAYSEGQVGWMPYVIERIDKVWDENRAFGGVADQVPEPPSTYIAGRIFGCIFDDETGLANRDVIGMDQITFETDYPHADSTFPHSAKIAQDMCDKAGLNGEERWKLLRGNAINAFGLERFGITE